jgi:phosphate acetyltransferase
MPLAGLLLTCGGTLAPEISSLLETPPLDSLPVLCTKDDTFTAAAGIAKLSGHAGREDSERTERAISFIAGRVDTQSLVSRLSLAAEVPMPPPVFRRHLIETARACASR